MWCCGLDYCKCFSHNIFDLSSHSYINKKGHHHMELHYGCTINLSLSIHTHTHTHMIKWMHWQNNWECIIKEPHKHESINNIIQQVLRTVKRASVYVWIGNTFAMVAHAKVACDVDIVEPWGIDNYVYTPRNKGNKMVSFNE